VSCHTFILRDNTMAVKVASTVRVRHAEWSGATRSRHLCASKEVARNRFRNHQSGDWRSQESLPLGWLRPHACGAGAAPIELQATDKRDL